MIKMRAGFQGDVSRQQLLNCGGKQASGSEFFSLHQFSQKALTACSSQALSRTNSEKKKKQWGRLGKYAGIWNGNGECLNGFVFVAGELPLFCKNMATAERYLWYELFIMTHNCDYFKWFCHSAFPCLLRLNSSFCERERRARAREVTSSSPVAL